MNVLINGAPRELPDRSDLIAALRVVGVEPTRPGIAVAVNDSVIRRASWPQTTLQPGDRVEIVTATQGG